MLKYGQICSNVVEYNNSIVIRWCLLRHGHWLYGMATGCTAWPLAVRAARCQMPGPGCQMPGPGCQMPGPQVRDPLVTLLRPVPLSVVTRVFQGSWPCTERQRQSREVQRCTQGGTGRVPREVGEVHRGTHHDPGYPP